MPKPLSAKYYQEKKKRLQKKLAKDIKIEKEKKVAIWSRTLKISLRK